MTIEWSRERRNLSDLVPWADNPRYITKTDAARLGESLDDFGQIQAIAIGPDNDILDGHQRTKVWAALDRYGKEYEVDVRVASRQLSDGERRKLAAMLHTGAVGSWDWDALASWDFEELQGWGFNTDTLTEWNDDAANLSLMLEAETPTFEPVDESEQPRLDQKSPITCPHCGVEFIPE